MKNVTLLCCLFMAAALAFTSCSPQDEALIQNGDLIEEHATYENFVKVNKTPELHTNSFDKEPLVKESAAKNNICDVCNPHISDFAVYNLGGNDRGFGISGGRNHPCSYELFWGTGAGSGYTVNWANGPFAHMTFNGPGTYQVWVNLRSGTGNTACIVAQYVTVTIP